MPEYKYTIRDENDSLDEVAIHFEDLWIVDRKQYGKILEKLLDVTEYEFSNIFI